MSITAERKTELLKEYAGGYLHGPFNLQARLLAGFDEDELCALQEQDTSPQRA